ncbi:MAG TPA: ATP synthase F1 subunit gamma [Candidatus Acidoferrales bacterium]|nr:ATP synthase F1 subunit gamma [Candidatus Acidoferrales bacterium]
MPSLRDLRRRIKGVQNMRKITKAMELVAAARMRRAQERVLATRPYSDEIASMMTELMRRSPQYQHPYLQVRPVEKRLIILVTGDRGLCGALNSNNTRLAVREAVQGSVPVSYVTIGRRGRDVIRRLHRDLVADQSMLGDRPTMGDVLPAARVAMEQFESGEVQQIDIVFAKFISVGRQQATLQRVIPVEPPEDAKAVSADFEYEPDPKDVLDALLPRYVEAQVYRAVLENGASEQAARMLAMRNASDNASEFIEDLTLTANKVRQASITTELMEIVGGAAALEG